MSETHGQRDFGRDPEESPPVEVGVEDPAPDVAEQQTPSRAARPAREHAEPAEREAAGDRWAEAEVGLEAPDADSVEQHTPLAEEETEDEEEHRRWAPSHSYEVNEADAADQDRTVGYDDDDYR